MVEGRIIAFFRCRGGKQDSTQFLPDATGPHYVTQTTEVITLLSEVRYVLQL